MLALRQIKAERRRAFALARKGVRLVEKLSHQQHRLINRKLSQRLLYLDAKDAQVVIEGGKKIWDAANQYAADLAVAFTAFFKQ